MQFSCPHCTQVLEAPDGVFSMEGKCRFCGTEIVSPAAAGASATLKQAAASDSFGAAAPPQPPYQGSRTYATYQPGPSRGSGVALASVILGVLGIITCGLTTLPGLICGIIALMQTGPNSDRRGGRTMAVIGTVISAILFLIIPIQAAILFPVFARARERAKDTSCFSNAKQLGMALTMYESDNGDRLPPAATWDAGLGKYVKSPTVFVCPSGPDGLARYKMNGFLGSANARLIASPGGTVALFDAAPGGTPFGGPGDVVARHNRFRNNLSAAFAFADGHASFGSPSRLPATAWKPELSQR
ncbi:MAG TPA: DUF4190 domain-containing protein [Armatimonadota bacterium]